MKIFLSVMGMACLSIISFPPSAISQEIQYINSLYWTAIHDVEVRGDYAYCSFDPGLVILDVSNVEEPTFVSRLYIPGDNFNIEAAGGFAFIFGDHDYLRIIDVSDPGNPHIAGEIEIDAEVGNIWVDGDYIYAAAGVMGMLIIDFSDPNAPRVVSRFDTSGDTEAVVVVDTLAFISERYIYPESRPFQIVNISDRSNPSLISYIAEDLGWNSDLVISGDYAYLANTYRGLIIVDISNLFQPSIVSRMEDITYPRKLDKQADYLFADSMNRVLQVIDVSTPELPEIAASFAIEGSTRDFDISGTYLYAAGDDLPILDISDIHNIRHVSGYDIPGGTMVVLEVGDYLYSGEPGFGLHIHDLIDPANPNQVNQYQLPSYWYTCYLKGDLLYVLGDNNLRIVDVSDPSSPGEEFIFTLDDVYSDVCVNEPYIYLTSFGSGVFVYERAGPDSLEFVRSFRCYDYSFDVEIEDDIGYFAQCFALNIFDLTIAGDSLLLSSIMPPGGAGKLFYHDGFIYTHCDEGSVSDVSFSVVDVRDPSNPSLASLMLLPNFVSDVRFDNDVAYIAVYPNELHAYDVTDPCNPVFLYDYKTSGYIRSMFLRDDYMYLAANTSLIILHVGPTGIEEVAEIPDRFMLHSNYPNPFNASTTIVFDIPRPGMTRLEVYNVLGQKVETIIEDWMAAGHHDVQWDASSFASGIYFYKLTAGDGTFSRRMTLLK